MKNIESTENENTFGDFFWVHIRGYLFIILAATSIILTLHMSIYYFTENEKSNIESIRYCPHCGQDLL